MKNRFENNETCDRCADSGVVLAAWYMGYDPADSMEDGSFQTYHWFDFTHHALGVVNGAQPGAWQWNKSKCHITIEDCTCAMEA